MYFQNVLLVISGRIWKVLLDIWCQIKVLYFDILANWNLKYVFDNIWVYLQLGIAYLKPN